MAQTTTITAKPRDIIGKANRRLAQAGLIPAVLYGAGRTPLPISVDRHDFEVLIAHNAASALLDLVIEGEKKPVNAVIKGLQTNTVKGRIEHIDFLAVKMDKAIHTTVTLHFAGESAGEKAGGVIMHNLREVTVEALPGDLPESIEVDVTPLAVGESLHVGQLQVPEGVTVLDDPETIVCSVTAPTVEPTPEEVVEEVEPAVVGEETAPEEA
ncbi:MAG: 50S ribosomal protein L25 [Coriobacteriia bacterium]|nr:50S ribosomal protein L25 [Coriobacteriia bacterium]